MSAQSLEMFRRFRAVIAAASEADIRADSTLGGRLAIGGAGNLTVWYAPFDHVNAAARVAIVGITPGAQQAANALLAARAALALGKTDEDVLAAAKVFASFSGPIRTNLVAMLDHVGLAARIGIRSCASLWTSDSALAHFTSALRYSVFLNGANYAGAPAMTAAPLLREVVRERLAEEAAALPGAVWIPLGPKAAEGLREVVRLGKLDPARILEGLPHLSGANAERIAYFLGRKARADLSAKTNAAVLDASRERLLRQVGALPFAA